MPESSSSADLPTLSSISNFREMGGLPAADGSSVRHGMLFRSGHLAEASDEDLDRLKALSIKTIVDFRTSADFKGDGGTDRIPDGVNHLNMEMIDSSGHGAQIRETLMSGDQDLINERYGNGQGHEMAASGVAAMALDLEKQQVYARFLDTVADDQDRPILWHCSAGKDRAGWAATLLGIALGVPDEALVEHYLVSNVTRPVQARIDYYTSLGVDPEPMRPFLFVHEDYINRGLQAIDQGWSTRQDYLTETLHFGPDRVQLLRDALLV